MVLGIICGVKGLCIPLVLGCNEKQMNRDSWSAKFVVVVRLCDASGTIDSGMFKVGFTPMS
jgi:hypothetical protein